MVAFTTVCNILYQTNIIKGEVVIVCRYRPFKMVLEQLQISVSMITPFIKHKMLKREALKIINFLSKF